LAISTLLKQGWVIDRSRLFAYYFVTAHPSGQMTGKGSKCRGSTGSITVLEVGDHERRGTREGAFEGKRKL
jgi:hypothetical protein